MAQPKITLRKRLTFGQASYDLLRTMALLNQARITDRDRSPPSAPSTARTLWTCWSYWALLSSAGIEWGR
jgi:hypothetical protein